MREIYVNLDDSGKLSMNEKVATYGGVVFISKNEKDKFINQYKKILNDFKCKYCIKVNTCDKKCPEIKCNNIKNKDKRRLVNYIKKYYVIGLVINNNKVYDYIKKNKGAKGRFVDYCIRRLVKNVIIDLSNQKYIDLNNDLKVIINIDEQPTKNNGYYNLKDGLYEELKHGIINFNYSTNIHPIVKKELSIVVKYHDSKTSYVIQAADLVAGTLRHMNIASNEPTKIGQCTIFMP